MTCAAFIPARGGSQRVHRKNLAEVGGRSLLRRTIDCAQEAGLSPIVVSTDDHEIASVAASLGAEVHARPAALATATAQIEEAQLHWLRRLPVAMRPVAVVLLQPTSPFRRAETVATCVRLLREHDLDSVLTISVDTHRATFTGRVKAMAGDDGHAIGTSVRWERPLDYRPRTQEPRLEAVENGCVYVTRRAHLLASRCRMGGRELAVPIDAVEAFEIDTAEQLAIVSAIAEVTGR